MMMMMMMMIMMMLFPFSSHALQGRGMEKLRHKEVDSLLGHTTV
jgi:hypothetical protein